MKPFYQFSFVASLFIQGALFLCFGSCQSSDNTKASEGASVRSLSLKAQLGETSSRVGMTDIYNSTFTCYWNRDKFNIYHKYRQYGEAVQNMIPLEFGTSATNAISATFSYTGSGDYYYNSGLPIYAFSGNTGGGYTTSVTADGTTTLTAPTLTNQNGTLSDCARYDALYGSSSVNSSTGLPGSLVMYHLFGMLNIHLCSNFSTGYPVTVTLSSSNANILPGNNGSATLKADGTFNTRSGSWSYSWSSTITPTSNGVLDIYLMTWPFSSIYGTLTVSCSDGSGYNYIPRTVTLSNFSLAAAHLKSNPLAIVSEPKTSTQYYSNPQWYSNNGCPTYSQICGYLSATCYWDNGGIPGGNTTNFIFRDNSSTRAGMWFRRGASGNATSCSPSMLNSAIASSPNFRQYYFFLPAIGYSYNSGSISNVGGSGDYWSSSSYNGWNSYRLYFTNSFANINYDTNSGCFGLWQAQ